MSELQEKFNSLEVQSKSTSANNQEQATSSENIEGPVATKKCPLGCPCNCHSRYRCKTPAIVEKFMGKLFYGYKGKPLLIQKCSFSGCVEQNATQSRVTYCFPRWFACRAVSFTLQIDNFGAPSFGLTTRRMVPEMSQIFTLSRLGDLKGLQDLLSSKMASPNDIHCEGQWTALHFAVDHGQVEVCQLLLNAGVDPSWEDYTGTTAVDVAWRNILHLRTPAEQAEVFSVLFPGRECLEERNFTKLHRTVIGLNKESLDENLKSTSVKIDAWDSDGWTPLHWAARRGEIKHLSLLLQHGANPFLATAREERTPLHLAALRDSVPCIGELLSYPSGNEPMNLNARDFYGNTPLRCAAEHNCAAALQRLIYAGADVNLTSRSDEPPLWSAVYNNSHMAIIQLMNAGAEVCKKTKYGDTLLHFAAQQSDLKTLALLTRARLVGLDIKSRNADGLTASQLAEARIGAPREFTKGFEHLLGSLVEDCESSSASANDDDEGWKSYSEASWHEAEISTGERLADAVRELEELKEIDCEE